MPMVPKFFRAAAFAANVFGDMGAGDTNWLGAECEDLIEAAWAQPFLARFLQCCLYWLFCIKHVCTKAGVFVFGAVGKAGHAVSFFARLHENAFAAVLRRSRILFQAGISHFVKTLKTDADLPPAITGRKLV